MKKEAKLKKIILMAIIFIIALLLGNRTVYGIDWIEPHYSESMKYREDVIKNNFTENNAQASVGKRYDAKVVDNDGSNAVILTKNKYMYCLEAGIDGPGYASYKVKAFIRLEGKTAYIYERSSGNPQIVTAAENAVMAYILAGNENLAYGYGNSDTKNERQKAFWYYSKSVWLPKIGKEAYAKGGNNYSSSSYNSYFKTEATKYANTVDTQAKQYGAYIWILEGSSNTQRFMVARPMTVSPQLGSLTIKKKDSVTGELKSQAKFAIKVSGNKYLKKNGDGWSFDAAWRDCTGFTINDANAGVTISNLPIGYKYTIWEYLTPDKNKYNITDQANFVDDPYYGAAKLAENIDLSGQTNFTFTSTLSNKPINSDLKVIKKDGVTGEGLNIKFKVQTDRYTGTDTSKFTWVGKRDNKTVYDATLNEATEFETSSGQKTVTNLPVTVKYKVWETEAPEGYDFTKQSNIGMNLTGNSWIDLTTGTKENLKNKNGNEIKYTYNQTEYNSIKYTKNVSYTNNPRLISIKGYVWVDSKPKGSETTNSLYDENSTDSRLRGVAVNLINKKTGEAINKEPVYTGADGSYEFKDIIKYSDLDNYYVQFDYSGLTIDGRSGKEYIPVAYNSKNENEIVENGSRALMNSIPRKDTDLTGIATTYTGNEDIYSLSSFVNKLYRDNTLNNINLGIKPIHEPEYLLTQDLEYVKVVLNNHEYIYRYGTNVNYAKEPKAAPQVSFQNPSIGLYERAIYPSAIYDLKERGDNTNGTLKVYVVYKININNTTNHQENELYREQTLHITNLTDTFDTNRYELSTTANSLTGTDNSFVNMENDIKGDFSNWEVSGNTATYRNEIEVANGGNTSRYIQFRIKENEILNVLNNQNGLNEQDPTTAHSNGYHEYTRNDYSWENLDQLPKTQTHESKYQTDNDSAPYLRLKLGEERKITGTVFEDGIDMTGRSEGEVLGNGRYENGENKVQGVLVELIGENNGGYQNGSVSKVYIASGDKKTYTISDAKTTTNENGKFTIEGIMPGKFYLRLTYANGDQCLIKPDGKIVKIDEYKSTIVTSDVARSALGYNTNNYGEEWYKHLESSNYSVAIDSLSMRASHNSGTKQNSMIAGTALFDITIENTPSNYGITGFNQMATFEGFNFGIIVQPKQKIDISKKITNVKLVNTPNVLFDGNPETENMAGVTDLDGINNNGSTYTRMEIETANIYGSELTLTYDIEVRNTSDINYYETDAGHRGWYYMFGEHNPVYSKVANIKVDEVIDCNDPVLTYASNSDRVYLVTKRGEDWENKEGTTTEVQKANRKIVIEKEQELANKNEDGKYSYKDVLGINGWGILARGASDNITLQFSKVLSAKDDDLNFINVAGISTANNSVQDNDKDNTNATETIKYLKPAESEKPALAESTISAPTGSNVYVITTIYVVSGIILLSLIACGIVLIIRKKK